ncbi:MAG: aminotransferase class I/II-fold pyridoxal phosphate-dependent enzyme [Loktanella sp.]|nr:aminotransferase class I/II-fold pyridoxal phosphate-dependent enzyme [Loktanella sp.]
MTDFDTPIDRRNTHCVKWDAMEDIYGVPADGGIAMWVADMEFRAAPPIQRAVQAMHDHGVYGYFGDEGAYRDAICWWMQTGGRVWTKAELQGIAAFAKRHELIIVSDEIHHDLTMPGQTHIPMAHIDGIEERLVMMTATTKTFNIAGCHSGNVIIADADLRARFAARMAAMGLSPNSFGLFMATAAYSPEGADWVDDVRAYLDGNRKVFDAGINAIPGLSSMPLEATYLSWVDFAGTGMPRDDFTQRVQKDARIAVNHGPTFGQGGDSFLRFNIAAPRAQIHEAVERMQRAFADLQ